MNYLKHYIKLIRTAQKNPPEGYFERHHVFPKSIFGDNSIIVRLSARQHYVAHALLEKIYIRRYGINHHYTRKMIHAFFMMNNVKGHGQQRYVNSKLFESCKLRFIERMTGENSPFFGKKKVFTEQHLQNMRNSKKRGSENPLYGIPRTKELIEKIKKPKRAGHGDAVSLARKGMKFSEEHVKNLSESHLGQVSWNKGKHHTQKTKEKMKESQKNKDHSFMTDEYKNKISESVKRVWAERKAKKIKESANGTH
jgi:hypothetical protein